MNSLIIAGTKSSFDINFDSEKGALSISGSSYPENAFDFFEPVTGWIKAYLETSPPSTRVNFSIDYMNTSTIKYVIDWLELFEKFHSADSPIAVCWSYPKDDEDIKEMGEELLEDYSFPVSFLLSGQ